MPPTVFEKKTSFDPRSSIVPIVEMGPNEELVSLLGTGFYTGSKERPIIVTAKHVFLDNPLVKGNSYGLICHGGGKKGVAKVVGLKCCKNFDVAVFHSSLYLPSIHPLRIAKDVTPLTDDVVTYEYSPSRAIVTEEGVKKLIPDAFTHKGNIMRHYDSNYPESIPTKSFDTSFPALQGASGAPVLRIKDYAVTGMLVANHERHLIPAQVVKIQHDENESEETSCYLPTGKALDSSVIITALESIGIGIE